MSEKEVYGVIYVIENKINGKKYVGQTTSSLKKRLSSHRYEAKRGSNNAIHKAIRRYGASNFEVKEVDVAFTKEELNSKEVYYIQKMRSHVSFGGYNITLGGDNASIRLYGTNNHKSVSVINLDTKEVFSTMTDALDKYGLKSLSSIHKVCNGLAKSYQGYHFAYYEDYLKGNVPKFKSSGTHNVKVINIDTLEVFDSIKDAREKLNIKSSKITNVCRGEQATCGGYRWAYYDDYSKGLVPITKVKKRKVEVINIDTLEVFKSIKNASTAYGVHKDSISNCLRGVDGQKTAGGYRWQYYEDYLKERGLEDGQELHN